MSKKKLEAAKLALKKAKEALEKLKKTNKPKPKPKPKPKVEPKIKPKPRKTKARIELRGGPKTNPFGSRATRKISQEIKKVKARGLTGREATKEIEKITTKYRSEGRKKGVSKPALGKTFREMYRAGRKPVRSKKTGKIITDSEGRPIMVTKRKTRRTRRR